MKKLGEVLWEGIALVLMVLFAYTSFSKWYDWGGTQNAMYNQVFPQWMATLLLYGLPIMELVLAIMLLFPKTRTLSLWACLICLISFTVYIGLVLTDVFGRIPCSCGGVISSLGWETHFLFNLGFVVLAVVGILVKPDGKGTLDMRRETED
ncbi:MauE/DoxX family redox-associated membrane protein [Echinicola shivajiensis]|uniref:MauE/DoxX family redox-associated membrane protein n=1 Tax=Echinicola shivajiensis TaxID=1035916 RepID=UPI001BFCBC03|nr:MauE/DoxX family redox-associated membrane protein [Echinicola shivajiensis]